MRYFLPAKWVLCLGLLSTPAAIGQEEGTTPGRYTGKSEISVQMEITGDATITMKKGPEIRLESVTGFHYTVTREKNAVELKCDGVTMKVKLNGTTTMDSVMNRDKQMFLRGGEKVVIKREDAPEELRKMFEDSFGTTLLKYNLDDDGQESDRELTAGPGAKMLINSGFVENARLFHSAFPLKKDAWKAPAQISMGQGNYVMGELDYMKMKPAEGAEPSDLVKVKVSGTLSKTKLDEMHGHEDQERQLQGDRRTDLRYQNAELGRRQLDDWSREQSANGGRGLHEQGRNESDNEE